MTVRIIQGVIHLEGHCRVEEAETLLIALQESQSPSVDLSQLSRLHFAAAQLLLAAQPELKAVPTDPFLRDWLVPMLRGGNDYSVSS